MERAPRRWTDYGLAGLVVALGVAYWHWRLVLPVPLPQPVGRWNGDLYNIYVPIYHYAYRSSRWLPSWNPYQLAGTPFVANYSGGGLFPPRFPGPALSVPPLRGAVPRRRAAPGPGRGTCGRRGARGRRRPSGPGRGGGGACRARVRRPHRRADEAHDTEPGRAPGPGLRLGPDRAARAARVR